VRQEPLDPVSISDLKKMLATCRSRTFTGDRHRAIMLALLDAGCRASEFLSLDVRDADLHTGAVIVRHAKGSKTRVVFLGAKARRAVSHYLRHLDSSIEALWVTVHYERWRDGASLC
jgi:site-specific recombinase XerD